MALNINELLLQTLTREQLHVSNLTRRPHSKPNQFVSLLSSVMPVGLQAMQFVQVIIALAVQQGLYRDTSPLATELLSSQSSL